MPQEQLRSVVDVTHEGEAQAAGSNVSQALARRLDGALLIVGGLNSTLKKKHPYSKQLEPMLSQHVMPVFASPYGHVSKLTAELEHG